MTEDEEGELGSAIKKKLQPGFLVGMVLQTIVLGATGAWYMSKQDSRILAVETAVSAIAIKDDSREPIRRATADRLAKLETEASATRNEVSYRLQRLEAKADRILEILPRQ